MAFTKNAFAQDAVDRAQLGPNDKLPVSSCKFTIGAEASNIINVAVQLVDGRGRDLQTKSVVGYYISTDSVGDVIDTDIGTIAIGTDGTIISEFTDDVCGWVLSESDGDIDFNLTDTAAETIYLNIVFFGSGKIKTSDAITYV